VSDYFGIPKPRDNVLKLLERDLIKNTYEKQILLSFIGDVYSKSTDDNMTTRYALEILNKYKAPVAVLSKGGSKMLRDLDVFKAFEDRIMVGTTLTFLDETKSKEWEPGAALPQDRLHTLQELKKADVKTMASFEPCIEPAESLKLIEKTLEDDSVTHYKIGKVNNYKGYGNDFDWNGYLTQVLELLRPAKKEIYVKRSLRKFAPNVELLDTETDCEKWVVRGKSEIPSSTNPAQQSFF
jgi:DNA repair photolyase